MKSILKYSLILLAILFTPFYTYAHWPTAIQQNLPISATTEYEGWVKAFPYHNGSTIITFYKGGLGSCFQVLDKFGNLVYPSPISIAPNFLYQTNYPKAYSDNQGGVVVVWTIYDTAPYAGVYAQRIDSLGNLLWGNAAQKIFPMVGNSSPGFDFCYDGTGSFLFSMAVHTTIWTTYAQKFDGVCNPLWGDTGVVVANWSAGSWIVPDGNGGAYVAGDHYVSGHLAIKIQHLDSNGQALWSPGGIQYFPDIFTPNQVAFISDNAGGCILHCGGNTYNNIYRINSSGTVLWTRDHISWYDAIRLIIGEDGRYYLCFGYGNADSWAQRFDNNGNLYWPTWGSGRVGLPIETSTWMSNTYMQGSCFSNGYFYCVYPTQRSGAGLTEKHIFIQKVDTTGCRFFGDAGNYISCIGNQYLYLPDKISILTDSEEGVIIAFEAYSPDHNVWAKRMNYDGTLGGPFPLEVDLTPHNTPIQIPANGGSFTYDIAIADTDSVGGRFDVWIKVTFPDNSTLEILSKEDMNIPIGGTITRLNIQQFIPARAPTGNYTYTVYAGNHRFDSPWGEANFIFSKSNMGLWQAMDIIEGWNLDGWFDSENTFAFCPLTFDLSAYPNPFNSSVALSFHLPAASPVELKIYDICGREIAALGTGHWALGENRVVWDADGIPSGVYFVRLTANSQQLTASGCQSIVRKAVLLK